MTHAYTLLLDATVLPGGGRPPCQAIAWAAGTVLALGSADEVQSISRGDSHVRRHPGCYVVPTAGPLEPGAPADLAVLDSDPREAADGPRRPPVAVYRAGRLVREAPAAGG